MTAAAQTEAQRARNRSVALRLAAFAAVLFAATLVYLYLR